VAFVAFEIVFGMSRALPLVFGSVMLVGLFSMLMVNTINVTIQSNVNHALRGRIMSLYTTVFAGSAPVGGLLAGFMAETVGAPAAFIIGASAAGVFVVLVGWQLLRRFGLYRINAGTPVSEMDGPIPVIAPPIDREPKGPLSAAG
jgi:MFS family permease